MIDPESEFRDAWRPVPIRSEAEVKRDARREALREAAETGLVAVACVAVLLVIACAGAGR